MRPRVAIEAPRVNSLHHEESLRNHGFKAGVLQVEDRVPVDVVEGLKRLGHRVHVIGAYMVDSGIAIAGVVAEHRTVVGAGDVRR